jgi:voltage-gated potassium channel Kch
VLYGDASKPKVLEAAGIDRPRAITVCYTARARAVTAVEMLHETYPDVPIYARALDMQHAAELRSAGARTVVTAETEAGLGLAVEVALGTGMPECDLLPLTEALRLDMNSRCGGVKGGGGGEVGGALVCA